MLSFAIYVLTIIALLEVSVIQSTGSGRQSKIQFQANRCMWYYTNKEAAERDDRNAVKTCKAVGSRPHDGDEDECLQHGKVLCCCEFKKKATDRSCLSKRFMPKKIA